MKNYEEMARDVLSRVSEYESEQKLKRARRTRIAAAATPVCAAAVIGAGIWASGALMHAEKPAASEDSGIISETVTVTESSKSANTGSSSAAVTNKTTRRKEQEEATGATSEEESARAGAPWKPDTDMATDETKEEATASEETSEPAVQTEAATQANSTKTTAANTTAAPRTTAAVTTQTQSGMGPMMREGDEPPQYRTLIQSYPLNSNEDMDAPKEGTFAIAYPVTMAMMEYGDTADYRVHVELFKNGNGGVVADYSSLCAESKRLYNLGYISGVEGYTNGGYTTYFLWIQATRDQVKSFQPSSEYGYILMFPYNNQGTSETVAFNGIDY